MFHSVCNIFRCGYAVHIEHMILKEQNICRITLLLFLQLVIIESYLYEVFLSIFLLNAMVPHMQCLLQMIVCYCVLNVQFILSNKVPFSDFCSNDSCFN